MDSNTSFQSCGVFNGPEGQGTLPGMVSPRGGGTPAGFRRSVGLSSAHTGPDAIEKEEKKEGIQFAKGGSVGKIVFSGTKKKRFGGGGRGKVKTFSRGSRRRLLAYVNSINREEVEADRAWFLTLTLPGQNPSQDPEEWQRWLKALRKRVERKWGKFPTVWKLEFQARGAAHWHLLAVVTPEMVPQLREFRQWLATAWYEVVGSGQETHRKAGTQVDPVRSWGGIVSYAGKYLGKDVPQIVNPETGEILTPGRFWGVWNKALAPIEMIAIALPREALFKIRRAIRRYTGLRAQSRVCTYNAFAPSKIWERLSAWAMRAPATPTQAGTSSHLWGRSLGIGGATAAVPMITGASS